MIACGVFPFDILCYGLLFSSSITFCTKLYEHVLILKIFICWTCLQQDAPTTPQCTRSVPNRSHLPILLLLLVVFFICIACLLGFVCCCCSCGGCGGGWLFCICVFEKRVLTTIKPHFFKALSLSFIKIGILHGKRRYVSCLCILFLVFLLYRTVQSLNAFCGKCWLPRDFILIAGCLFTT